MASIPGGRLSVTLASMKDRAEETKLLLVAQSDGEKMGNTTGGRLLLSLPCVPGVVGGADQPPTLPVSATAASSDATVMPHPVSHSSSQ